LRIKAHRHEVVRLGSSPVDSGITGIMIVIDFAFVSEVVVNSLGRLMNMGNERFVVFDDYDVDGVISLALLTM
jgi:hypothetical protein